jgi:predicted lipid-binding transport protein (Tim44 family)
MLTGEVAEVGTELPTVTIAGARERFAELARRDEKFSWPAFQQRVALVFDALHDGWTARDWRRVRPYVSDQLFQSQKYWIDEYKRQKLNNRTDGARIVDTVMSNVETDKHYDAVTGRGFASGKDYTIGEDGELVSGSKTFDRQYSEYWTLIRGVGASGDIQVEPSCPNCGAEVSVNMAGACTHCDVKVTRGDFDWVLSRIEQDETYR